MDVKVKQHYVKIFDSYQFSKIDFDRCLDYIEDRYDTEVFQYRSRKSLKREWAVHNFLYRNFMFRSRTADVTFEASISKWLEKTYLILGFLVYPGIE